MTARDLPYMQRAMKLAAIGRGAVEPNPLVGAVVVANDQIVGEGYHQKYGEPHAEVNAFASAGEKARGSTLYVTLEPCCHHGKTPPCTDAVLRSGVTRVVVAMADPFPAVSGQGVEILRQAGMEVAIGCCEEEARSLNAPYLKLLSTGRPYVHAKWAMTLDGRIATATGESKWITGVAAREHAHAFRGTVDAIIVGLGTVLADDPMLTARPPGPRTPTRVVLDTQLRIPTSCQLVRTANEFPLLLATTAEASESRMAELLELGCECLVLPASSTGGVDVESLLGAMGKRRWTNVLVEGGARLLGSFLDADQMDAARVYIAGKVIGGAKALGPIGGEGIGELAKALTLGPLGVTELSGDLFVNACRCT